MLANSSAGTLRANGTKRGSQVGADTNMSLLARPEPRPLVITKHQNRVKAKTVTQHRQGPLTQQGLLIDSGLALGCPSPSLVSVLGFTWCWWVATSTLNLIVPHRLMLGSAPT